jgi:predicted DCC family thiol-disulfide oxidoreductase YuxK
MCNDGAISTSVGYDAQCPACYRLVRWIGQTTKPSAVTTEVGLEQETE